MPQHQNESVLDRLMPYAFLCTIGPSVTAATSLFIVRYLMCIHQADQHGEPYPDPGGAKCNDPNVGALTASVMAGLAALDGVFSFLSTSYVQRLADHIGRRPLMIALPLLAMIASGSMVLAYIAKIPALSWLLLALNGIFIAASTKSVFVPTLCIADVASEENMTNYYSKLEATSLIGPGSAYLLSALSSRYIPIVLFPYYIALACQFLASLYVGVGVPETLTEEKQAEVESIHSQDGIIDAIIEPVVQPIKPLKLLIPHRDPKSGKINWKLFIVTLSLLFTTSGTVFIVTASLLFLSDKFSFDPEKNAWVLSYLAFSKGIYLTLFFPSIQKWGRKLFVKYEDELQPLLNPNNDTSSTKEGQEEIAANKFDVILLFFSVCFDSLSLILISLAKDWKMALIGFTVFALGAGDNPTYKTVFVASVSEDHASQALAALDIVFNAARLISPLILGSIYAAFAEVGRPEMLFVVAGGLCAVGAALLAPLIFTKWGNKQ